LDTATTHNKSNAALQLLRSGLETLGYLVEGGEEQRTLYRPVHFGEYGKPDRQYHIDSYNSEHRVGLEVEAGRSIRGNAIYRDIIQTSLLVDVDYFALAIPQKYRFKVGGRGMEDRPYDAAVSILDAIYSCDRLRLPLKGVLLLGY
jgi:hypothetical protein